MTDPPAVAVVRAPLRRCVGCRRQGERSVLLRFAVVEVDGRAAVVHDARRALPGRGAWLHPDPDCWDLARRRSALNRALRTGVSVDQEGISAVFAALTPENDRPVDQGEPGHSAHTSPSPSAATRGTGSGSER